MKVAVLLLTLTGLAQSLPSVPHHEMDNYRDAYAPRRLGTGSGFRCGCTSCTSQVLHRTCATDTHGSYTCGSRISWLINHEGLGEREACRQVSADFAVCGPCNPGICSSPSIEDPLPSTEELPPSTEEPPPTTPSVEEPPPTSAVPPSTDEPPPSVEKPPPTTEVQPPRPPEADVNFLCGCGSCSPLLFNELLTDADGTYSFFSRVRWLEENEVLSERDACRQVTQEFQQHQVGSFCNPDRCDSPRCGCQQCNAQVLGAIATDSSGSFSCGSRIDWLVESHGFSERDACIQVARQEFSNGPCGMVCDPDTCGIPPPAEDPPSLCGCGSCSPTVFNLPLNDQAGSHSLISRVRWLQDSTLLGERDACRQVASEFPNEIGSACNPDRCDAPRCGCHQCNSNVLGAVATDATGSFSCGSRIDWLMEQHGLNEQDACRQVSAQEFAGGPCGPQCDPDSCGVPPSADILPSRCGCESCSEGIRARRFTDDVGTFSFDSRIDWVMENTGVSERDACRRVASQFPNSVCSTACNPDVCDGPRCGCDSCSSQTLQATATGNGISSSCGSRIDWVMENLGLDERGACRQVAGQEFPGVCGNCDPDVCDGGCEGAK